jgi:aryl-alcohol dehydrogenase-like predicted oxidoreductase
VPKVWGISGVKLFRLAPDEGPRHCGSSWRDTFHQPADPLHTQRPRSGIRAPIAVDQGIGTLVWCPLAGGLLSGECQRGAQGPDDAHYGKSWDELPIRGEKALYDIVDTLIDIAKQRDASASRTGWHACLGNRTLPHSLSAPAPRKNNLKAIELSQTDDELQGPRPS